MEGEETSEEERLLVIARGLGPKQSRRLPRGACPERHEILRYAQNDPKRRARNDSYELLNDLDKCI